MSLFSGLKRLVRGAAKIVAPALIATIPGVGPVAAKITKGVIAARAGAKAVTRARGSGIRGQATAGRRGRGGARGVRRSKIAPQKPLPGVGMRQIQPITRTPTQFIQRAPVGTAPSGVAQMSIFSAIPPLIGVAGRAIGGAARTPVGRAVIAGATTAAGVDILVDEFGNPIRPRRRRMNFGNAKAARRAIRRIKGTRKLLQDIEKQLPRRAAPRPRRDLPAGHTHVR